MNLQEVFRRELDIIAVHLIVIFSFHEERSIDVRKELIRHFFKVISEVGGVFRMAGNVILLDKLFKNREIKITGNILSACICIGIEVDPVNLVAAGVKGYLLLRNGEGDLSVCDSLENGVILLYNRIKSRVAAEQDLLLDEAEIDAILLGRDSGQPDAVSQIVRHQAQEFVSDLLSSLRERMLELKIGKVIFTGGGAVLLRQQIEASDKVREPVFIEDIAANVKGYQLLYQAERIGRHNGY